MNQRLHWLALALTPGLGPATIKKLLARFGSAEAIFSTPPAALASCPFLRQESASFLTTRKGELYAAAERELSLAAENGVCLLGWEDALFPPLLRAIPDPPPLLYVKGAAQALSRQGIAIVGARAASSYGVQVAHKLAADLVRSNLAITSGLALGVDTAAHRGALAAGGKTIAVLGCGIDIVYPAQNEKLFAQIAEAGALVSEYPFGTLPENFRFPARNRIISGLSLGVVVVEAARRSGTLITAQQALEQGREVFVVPGRIDSPKSEGCHRLAQEGAKLIHSVADIIEELPPATSDDRAPRPQESISPPTKPLAAEEQRVFTALEVYPRNIEEIITATGLSADRVQVLLLHLELQGLAISLPGKQYQRLAEPSASSV